MNVPSTESIGMLCLCVIVPSLLYTLVTKLWSLPLKNGRGFFLGVEVGPGFYNCLLYTSDAADE